MQMAIVSRPVGTGKRRSFKNTKVKPPFEHSPVATLRHYPDPSGSQATAATLTILLNLLK